MPRRAFVWPTPVAARPNATAEERAMLQSQHARLRERLSALWVEREAVEREIGEIERYLRALTPLLALEGLTARPPAEGASEG